AADADWITHGLAVAEHVVERALVGFHHDRAARIVAGESDDLARLRRLRQRRGGSKQERSRRGCEPAWKVHGMTAYVVAVSLDRVACRSPRRDPREGDAVTDQ